MSWAKNGTAEVYWDEQGTGDPVVLAMGHSWDARFWWPLMPVLVERYRVIRFDNRGIGRTRWDGSPFLIEDLADDAFAVMDAAGVDKAHVYGMSMGGLTVQEMALRHPERVASLVLGCTGAFSTTRGSWLDNVKAVIPFDTAMKLFKSALYGPLADPAAIAEDLRLMDDATTPRSGRLAQTRAINLSTTLPRVPQIVVPTLVIHGTHDKAIKLAMGKQLAAAIPGAELCVLDKGGHNYLADEGRAGEAALLAFLAEQPAIGG